MLLKASQQQQTTHDSLIVNNSSISSNPAIIANSSVHHLKFSRETWIVLLKVLLGIADRLLTENNDTATVQEKPAAFRRGSYIDGSIGERGTIVTRWGAAARGANNSNNDRDRLSGGEVNVGPRMGDALVDSVTRVLIEVWLRSGEMDKEIWDCLK
ncbi:hypothetical protein HK100_008028, partial [Physocladia obscura]